MSLNQDVHEQDFEINVREHLEVLVKRKIIVLAPVITLALFVLAWAFTTPMIYEVSMVIAPPTSETAETGIQDLDTVGNIRAKIESGAFNEKIIDELNIPKKNMQFQIVQPKEAKLLKISIEETPAKTELGKKILTALLKALEKNYAQFIENRHLRIDNQIKIAKNRIGTKENEVKLKKEQLNTLADKEQEYLEEIKESRTNSEKLLVTREALLERKEGKDDISALLFTATIQQNLNYLSQLQNELFEVKTAKESAVNAIENLANSIKDSQVEIDQLNLSVDGTRNVTIIQEPLISMEPVGPKKIKSVFLAGIIGLILGVLSAFIVEHWEPKRSRG